MNGIPTNNSPPEGMRERARMLPQKTFFSIISCSVKAMADFEKRSLSGQFNQKLTVQRVINPSQTSSLLSSFSEMRDQALDRAAVLIKQESTDLISLPSPHTPQGLSTTIPS